MPSHVEADLTTCIKWDDDLTKGCAMWKPPCSQSLYPSKLIFDQQIYIVFKVCLKIAWMQLQTLALFSMCGSMNMLNSPHRSTGWTPLKSIIWRKILECFPQKPLSFRLKKVNIQEILILKWTNPSMRHVWDIQ